MLHFDITQQQQHENLKTTIGVVLFGIVALFVIFCRNQSRKPKYDYRQDFFSEHVCYVIEKRWWVVYKKLDGEVFLEAHEAELRKQELNNKK